MIRPDAPDGAAVLDLAAARAARQEARAKDGGGNPYLKLAAGFVEVKPEVPISAIDDLQAGNLRAGVAKLVVDPDDTEVLVEDGLTDDDIAAILEFIAGGAAGESAASLAS